MSPSEEFVAWKPEPNFRGTFSILVTCVTTLGICVWSSLHLNIPKERPTWKQNLVRKIVWMSMGVFAPECLTLFAISQYLSAREVRDKVNERLRFSRGDKQCTQGLRSNGNKAGYLLSDPGEVMTRGSEPSQGLSSDKNRHPPLQDEVAVQQAETGQVTAPCKYVHRWTLVHGFYAVMGGFVHQTQDGSGNVTHTVISPQGFIQLLEARPDLIPDISEESICDKSKSNTLAKTLLTVQVGWFCVNCISRLAQRLPLTLLEVSTVAHAACSLLFYTLWWHKPLDVTGVILVPYANVDLEAREEGLFATEADSTTDEAHTKYVAKMGTFSIIGVGVIYGAPHFLAWTASFATQTEQLLWRICTCTAVGSPIICGISCLIAERDGLSDFADTTAVIMICLSVLLYLPANLYLVAASLRQLCHLPPAAFKLPLWSSYLPHIS